MENKKYYVIVEEKDGYFYGYLDGFPSCNATGKTINKLEENFKKAIVYLTLYMNEPEFVFDYRNNGNTIQTEELRERLLACDEVAFTCPDGLSSIPLETEEPCVEEIEDKIKLKELYRLDKKFKIEDNQDKISKVESLLNVLDACCIDDENTVFGTEPVYKNTFNGEERKVIKGKIMDLIKNY